MPKKKSRESSENDALAICYGMICILISLITLLHDRTGLVGRFLAGLLALLVGRFYPFWCGILIIVGLYLIFEKHWPGMKARRIIGVVVAYLALAMVFSIPSDHTQIGFKLLKDFASAFKDVYRGTVSARGGLVGVALYALASGTVSFIGSIIIIVMLFILSFLLIVDVKWLKDLGGRIAVGFQNLQDRRLEKKAAAQQKPQTTVVETKGKGVKELFKGIRIEDHNNDEQSDTHAEPARTMPAAASTAAPAMTTATPASTITPSEAPAKQTSAGVTKSIMNYRLPRITLLDSVVSTRSSANRDAAAKKSDLLLDILSQFDVPCELTGIHIGPAVTKFEVKPSSGIKVSKITSIQNNIKMGLAVRDLRIEAPVPGKNAVGIEIPNQERINVRMMQLLKTVPDKLADKPLLVALGKDLSGENVYGQLDKMPHLLIAGATGSGKSVCINAIIISLLLRTNPNDVKLLLIDPKKVEFTPYIDIPHLVGPVISETSEASEALKTIVEIMENRYTIFHDNNVKNIDEYNAKATSDPSLHHMFYIVVIIDELADLMATNGKDVEQSIQRITQLARASGIHLIVATQRPSTDDITGTIKTNIPSRIAFAVSSAIDSRIILDMAGAEDLLGNGDMLYVPMGESVPDRLQGVYVTDDEINRITEFVKSQGKPNYDDAFVALSAQMAEGDGSSIHGNNSAIDPQYEEVKKFVAQTQRASTSTIQRYFGFGYNRAARIIDMMEQEGVIGPINGSKPREVYMKKPDEDDKSGQ